MSGVQVSGVVGRIGWGGIGDQLGDRLTTLAIIACTTAVGALLVANMTPEWPKWLIAGLLGLLSLSSLGWNGVYLAEITHLASPRHVADAAGGCLVFTYGGVLLGLPTVTVLHTLLGDYTTVFAILAGISLLGLWLIRKARLAREEEAKIAARASKAS